MIEYGRVVFNLNEHRKSSNAFALVSQFLNVGYSIDEQDIVMQAVLVDCWKLLLHLVGEFDYNPNNGEFTKNPVLECEYTNWTKDAKEENPETLKIIQTFIERARIFLENQLVDVIKMIIQRNTNLKLGSEPSNLALIDAYLNTIDPNWEKYQNQFWIRLFYCIRCGFIDDAIKLVDQKKIQKN